MATNYSFKNKRTGKTISFSWDGPGKPTPKDINKIQQSQAQANINRINSRKEAVDEMYRVDLPIYGEANIPRGPMKAFSKFQDIVNYQPIKSKELFDREGNRIPSPEDESLPMQIGRSLAQTGQEMVTPGNIALGFTGALPIRAGIKAAIPAAFALEGARHIPEAAVQTYENPTPYNITNLGTAIGGTALMGKGVRDVLKAPPVDLGEYGVGETFPPKQIETRVQPRLTEGQRLLTERPIDEPFTVDEIVNPEGPPQLPPGPPNVKPAYAVTPEGEAIPTQLRVEPPINDTLRFTNEPEFVDTNIINEPIVERPPILGEDLLRSDVDRFKGREFPNAALQEEPVVTSPIEVVEPSNVRSTKQIKRLQSQIPVESPIKEVPPIKEVAPKLSLADRFAKIKELNEKLKIKKLTEAPQESSQKVSEFLDKESEGLKQELSDKEAAIRNINEDISPKMNRAIEDRRKQLGISPAELERRLGERRVSQEQAPKLSPKFQEKFGKKKEPIIEPSNISKDSPRSEIESYITQSIKDGASIEDIATDLADAGFTESSAIKVVSRMAKKLKGEAGFAGKAPKFVENSKRIILEAKRKVNDAKAKEILEKSYDPTFFDKFAKGPEFVMGERMGPAGKEMQTLADRVQQREAEIAGNFKADFNKSAIASLTDPEFKEFHDMTNGKSSNNPKVVQAYKDYINLIDKPLVQRAIKARLKSKDISRKEIPFKGIEVGKYFPRYATESAKVLRRDILDEIVKKENVGYADAWNIMKNPKSEYYAKAQHARVLPEELADYEINKEAIIHHINDMSKQIAVAEILGPDGLNNPKVSSLLQKIAQDRGVPARNEALDTMKRLVFPEYKDVAKYEGPINDFITTATSARYLTLFPISNLSNSFLTFVRGSNRGLLEASGKYLYNMALSQEKAMRSGSLDQLSKIEYAPAKNIVSKILGKEFDFAETHARSWSNEVGRETAIDVFNKLKRGGLSKTTTKIFRQKLQNAVLDNVDSVLSQNVLSEAQLRQAGFQMVKNTQGIVSSLSMPKPFQNANFIINQLLMFKRYAGIQTGNMVRAYRENPARFIATTAALAPVLGELVGDALAGTRGALASIFTDEKMKDAINREVFQERGKYYAQIFRGYGMSEEAANNAGRLFDNYNRAFVLGLLGDFVVGMAESPEGISSGRFPGIDLVNEFIYDILKLAKVTSEDVDLSEAAQPLKRSLLKSTPAGTALPRSIEAGENANPYSTQ